MNIIVRVVVHVHKMCWKGFQYSVTPIDEKYNVAGASEKEGARLRPCEIYYGGTLVDSLEIFLIEQSHVSLFRAVGR